MLNRESRLWLRDNVIAYAIDCYCSHLEKYDKEMDLNPEVIHDSEYRYYYSNALTDANSCVEEFAREQVYDTLHISQITNFNQWKVTWEYGMKVWNNCLKAVHFTYIEKVNVRNKYRKQKGSV